MVPLQGKKLKPVIVWRKKNTNKIKIQTQQALELLAQQVLKYMYIKLCRTMAYMYHCSPTLATSSTTVHTKQHEQSAVEKLVKPRAAKHKIIFRKENEADLKSMWLLLHERPQQEK